ncbi:MAG: 16S rRNA (guanine(527)-N(7))-methyltransferase RsmG [Dehalococcoidia bacterium]
MYHRSGERAFGVSLRMEWDELPGLFPMLPEPARWLPLLRRHLELIVAAEEHTRVTSVAPADAIQRHYAESLETWRIAVEASGSMPATAVDVGSGGGFPGLVMACITPGTTFHLVEPLQKRARLLEAMASDLGLSNVRVHPQRAEDAGKGPLRDAAPLVTARAVAKLAELLEYTAPFAAVGGLVALPKGSGLAGELEHAARAMEKLSCRHLGTWQMRPEVSDSARVAVFEKTAMTGSVYPRRAGVPGKQPL